MSWDKLRQHIDRYFSLEDIKTLCFDLGISYDSLGGEAKPGKIRELIDFCRRNNKVPQLIAYLARERSHVEWHELVIEEDPTPAPPPPQQPQATAQQVSPPPAIVTPLPAEPSQRAAQTLSPALQTPPSNPQPAPSTGWRNWGDHPVVVIIGVIAAIFAIFAGIQSLLPKTGSIPTPTAEPSATAAAELSPAPVTSAPTSAPPSTPNVPTITLMPTSEPTLEPGAIANTAAAETATAIFVEEGTRAASTATAAAVTPVPTINSAFVFYEEFDGSLDSAWRVVIPSFAIANGHLQGNATAQDIAILAVEKPDANYTINADIKGADFWILFRTTLTPEKSGILQSYALSCGAKNCAIIRTDSEAVKPISTYASREQFSVNEFHDVTIIIEGSNFIVKIDNEDYLSAVDDKLTSGGFGFVAIGVEAGYSDGFEVDSIRVSSNK